MTTLLQTAEVFVAAAGPVVRRYLYAAGHPALSPTLEGYLRAVVESPGTTVGHLSRRFDVSQQAVSKMVKVLVHLGYVEVEADTVDSRRRPLHPTPRGLLALAAVEQAHQQVEESLPIVEDRQLAMQLWVEAQVAP